MGRRSVDQTRRRAIQNEVPPRKCAGHTANEREPCDNWAVVGAVVCSTHGGRAPQVKAAAERRITLAERLRDSPQRQPWEVMEDTAHIADVLMQDARVAIEAGTFTPENLDKLVSSLERAHRLSNANVQTGLSERRQRFAEGQAMAMHKVFTRVLSGLGLSPEQRALVPELLKREIQGVIEAGTTP